MLGTVRSGILPLRRNSMPQRGRETPSGMYFRIVFQSIFSGIDGLPQSRPWENDQSRVTIRPFAPARFARSARAASVSRSPTQYIWKKVLSLAAQTSSTERLADDDKPIAGPRRAGAGGGGAPPPGV